MLVRDKLLDTISKLPVEFSLDKLMDKLILIDKIDKGNKQSENNEMISEEELNTEMKIGLSN